MITNPQEIKIQWATEEWVTYPYVNLSIPPGIILDLTQPNQSSAKAASWHVKKNNIKGIGRFVNMKLKVKS